MPLNANNPNSLNFPLIHLWYQLAANVIRHRHIDVQ